MFQNKKLKRNATYAIAEVAEVALCASNCALPTSGCNRYKLENNSLVSGMCPDVVVSYCSYCFFCKLIKGERVEADAPTQLLIQ